MMERLMLDENKDEFLIAVGRLRMALMDTTGVQPEVIDLFDAVADALSVLAEERHGDPV